MIGKYLGGCNRLLVEIWMLKAVLRRKGGACYWKLGESLGELCPAVLWKAECGSNELGHLAEEIPKERVEELLGFFLPFMVTEEMFSPWT